MGAVAASGPQVRLAGQGDASALAGLRAEWSPPPEPDDGAVARLAPELARWLGGPHPRALCAVAEDGAGLVGMAWLVPVQRVPNPGAPRRTSADLQSVYVRPVHRGTGLGRRLVTLLLEEARARGLGDVTVVTNEAADGFYRRLGFGDGVLVHRAPS